MMPPRCAQLTSDLAGDNAAWQTLATNQATTLAQQVSSANQALATTTSGTQSTLNSDALAADELLAGTEADDQAAEALAVDQAGYALGEASSTADAALSHATAVAQVALDAATALAGADYNVNLANQLADALSAVASASGLPVDVYQSQIAAALASQAAANRTARLTFRRCKCPRILSLPTTGSRRRTTKSHADRLAAPGEENAIANAEAAATIATAQAEEQDLAGGGGDENSLATVLAGAANNLATAQQQADDGMSQLEDAATAANEVALRHRRANL